MVNDTVIRNFFYTSTPEHEGVLFHIPSGRFFRVFDEKCKSDFRQIFEIGSLSEDVLEMLHKIIREKECVPVPARIVIIK